MKPAAAISAALALGASSLVLAARNAPSSAPSQPAAADARLAVSVEGVNCASCTLSIRRALKKIDGVKKVEAGSESNQAVVTYDAAKVRPEQIVQTINDLGFKVGTPIKG